MGKTESATTTTTAPEIASNEGDISSNLAERDVSNENIILNTLMIHTDSISTNNVSPILNVVAASGVVSKSSNLNSVATDDVDDEDDNIDGAKSPTGR